MKNILMTIIFTLVCAFTTQSYAGECSGNTCNLLNRSVRKAVIVTKNIVSVPVNFTKKVIKYQPLRRRLVYRSIN